MKKAVSTVYFIMLAAVVLISVFSLLYGKKQKEYLEK